MKKSRFYKSKMGALATNSSPNRVKSTSSIAQLDRLQALNEILQPLGLHAVDFSNQQRQALYDLFCSIPFACRGDEVEIEWRLHLITSMVDAVSRFETHKTIRNSLRLTSGFEDLRLKIESVLSEGQRGDK